MTLDELAALGGFIYLGSPYSLMPDRNRAARAVGIAAARLMARGIVVYSPIAHGHYVSRCGKLGDGWDFWKRQCQPFIDAAAAMIVLKLDGWDISVGLDYEVREFHKVGKPIVFLAMEDTA